MSELKLNSLVNCLKSDVKGSDLKLTFFISSLNYKFNSCCIPFPSNYIQNGVKDIETLTKVAEKIPAIEQFLKEISNVDHEVVDLLHWLFVEINGPRLEIVAKENHHKVLGIVAGQEGPVVEPNYIFKIIYRDDSTTEKKFQDFKSEFTSSYAFHGTKIFNFHSILHHGLHQHLNKTALFGEGLYFSNETNVSLPYSQIGSGWKKSFFGSSLSCMVLCELVEHPVFTKKCQKEATKLTDLPEKYIVVSNNDVVRPRFLMVYAKGQLAIGLSDSRYIQYLKQLITRKLNAGIESIRLLFGK